MNEFHKDVLSKSSRIDLILIPRQHLFHKYLRVKKYEIEYNRDFNPYITNQLAQLIGMWVSQLSRFILRDVYHKRDQT